MNDKTFGDDGQLQDPILAKQREDVARMRTSLLCCNDDPTSSTQALQNITVLRVYHQVSRIIRYLDMMDKLEAKLYEAIDFQLDTLDTTDTITLRMLLSIQENLQKTMIESHKILQPYLNIADMKLTDLAPKVISTSSEASSLISKTSRDKIRLSAQQALELLGGDVKEHIQENVEENSNE